MFGVLSTFLPFLFLAAFLVVAYKVIFGRRDFVDLVRLAAIAAVLIVLAGLTASCSPPQAPSDIYIQNVNTNNNGGSNPSASPSPGSGSGTLPEGSTIRVALFGQDCPTGVERPNNGTGQISVRCSGGAITATPKGPNGADLPAEVHGTQIEWSGPFGAAGVSCTPSFLGNAFNQLCKCAAAGGTFTLSAKVKNVTGVFAGTCVP